MIIRLYFSFYFPLILIIQVEFWCFYFCMVNLFVFPLQRNYHSVWAKCAYAIILQFSKYNTITSNRCDYIRCASLNWRITTVFVVGFVAYCCGYLVLWVICARRANLSSTMMTTQPVKVNSIRSVAWSQFSCVHPVLTPCFFSFTHQFPELSNQNDKSIETK